MKKVKDFEYYIHENQTKDDYVCDVVIKGEHFDKTEIETSITCFDNVKTRQTINNNTGEILLETQSNTISDNNTKVYSYLHSADFGKSKNVPRTKVYSGNKDIIDLCKEQSEYLQASTGTSHDKRGIITVDLDLKKPTNINTHAKTKKFVESYLQKRFALSKALGIPLPTSYQIHLTNGHVQLFWVLKKEIIIKEKNYNTIKENGKPRNFYYLDKKDLWNDYKKLLKFLSIFYDGDPAFTGWQIKNMFVSDKIYKKDFLTIWNDNGVWSETEPQTLKRYKFERLYEIIYEYISNPDSEKFKLLNRIMPPSNHKTNFTELIFVEFMLDDPKIQKQLTQKNYKTVKSTCANLKYGRNQFVRMSVYATIRAFNNKISFKYCKIIVEECLSSAIKEYKKLKGTKNNTPYTKEDFNRDFASTYNHARLTYDKNKCNPSGYYSPEQRERAECQKRTKKNARLVTLLAILYENPNLIPYTHKNSIAIIKLFKIHNIIIKSTNTISNYKKQLNINKNQTRLSPKNYKFADYIYKEKNERYAELKKAFSNVNVEDKDNSYLNKWVRRIQNLNTTYADSIFLKDKRFSIKYHTKPICENTKLINFYKKTIINELLKSNKFKKAQTLIRA